MEPSTVGCIRACGEDAGQPQSNARVNESDARMSNSDLYRCSVVIPVLNEERTIRECLQSLANSKLESDRFEVLVVDNGSTDETVQIASSFACRLSLAIITKPGVTIAALRNAGAAAARGRVLAFLDADCCAPAEWLELAAATVEKEGGLVGGPYTVPPSYNWVAQVWSGREVHTFRGARSYLHGGNLIVRRCDFLAVSGFDEALQTNEDFEFCQRARSAGFRISAFSELGVVHFGTVQELRRFFRKQRWHGKDVLKVFLSNWRAKPNLRPLSFAVFTLLAAFGTCFGGVLWLAGGTSHVLVASLLALLAGPLLLSIRETVSTPGPRNPIPLACLFLVYGLARAACLIEPRASIKR